ncbi:MAG: ubiquitin-like protein [Candidatus Odinarchaeia archaeon]
MIIEIVSAIGDKKITLNVEPLDTFKAIKRRIAKELRIPESSFVIVFKGIEQKEEDTLKKAGVLDKDRLYVLVRTEGGIGRLREIEIFIT